MMESIKNIESTDKWLYLGADAKNPFYAKIGLTLGNLASRSYSSANPNYYIFCAFKCKYNLLKHDIDRIENDILTKFEKYYRYENGLTKRMMHYESGRPSECFCDIDFLHFFISLHLEIYSCHRNSFVISGMNDGEFVDCEFNPKVGTDKYNYIRMITQY